MSNFQVIGDGPFGGDVLSVDGRTGAVILADLYAAIDHTHSSGDIISFLGYVPEDSADKAAANGYASLDADGKLPTSQLPPLSITSVFVVASEVEQLALTVEEGDVAIRTDESKSYIALNDVNASMSDWQELLSPPNGVTSVDGRTGTVTLGDLYANTSGLSIIDQVAIASDASGNVKFAPVNIDPVSRAVTGMGRTEQDDHAYFPTFPANIGLWWSDNGLPTGIFRFAMRSNNVGTLLLTGAEGGRVNISSSEFRIITPTADAALYVIGGITTEDNLNVDGDLDVGGDTRLETLNVAGGLVQTDADGDLSSSVTLPDGTLAMTQSPGDASTKIATTGYVDTIPGMIDGFVVKYEDTTHVDIATGRCEANGSFYELSSVNNHLITSLAAGADFHYIYIDDDASSPPSPTIIDSTTEPAWSDSKRGWYNGDDRCIGVIWSLAASATIAYFDTVELNGGKLIRYSIGRSFSLRLATNMDPDGAWQIPNTNESDVAVPVSAKEIYLQLANSNAAASLALYGASKEWADVNTTLLDAPFSGWGYNNLVLTEWIPLAASRKIRIGGLNADDSLLNSWVCGFGYQR